MFRRQDAKSIDSYSIQELKSLLSGLGGTFSGGEKKELIESVQERVTSISIKELKQKLSEKNISIPPGSEKSELVSLLAAWKPQAAPSSQAPAAVSFDLSSWTDQEISVLAKDRKVDIAGLSRVDALRKLDHAAKSVAPIRLLESLVGIHNGFRKAALNLEESSKRLAAQQGAASDQAIDQLMKQLEEIESSLKGHGSIEEKTLFPFFAKNFASFLKYDSSLESQV